MGAAARARWRVLQVADSAFPTGGFAHSAGLEAAVQLGEVSGEDGVRRFGEAALWQAGTFGLPWLRAARSGDVVALDRRCEAAQSSHVARRASRQQGRAWLRVCGEAFGVRVELPVGHLPVAFGATAARLEVGEEDAREVWLHLVARGVLSAAVRLGVVGPHAAQRLQDGLGAVAERVIALCGERAVEDAAHSAPLQELFGTLHDGLSARLFQS